MTKMVSNGRFEILVYHRIGRENSFDGLTIAKNIFAQQMQYIRRYCKPMALGDLVRSTIERKTIPPRAVAVTFDDGYADTFKIAFPILKRVKILATIFVTTGYIDRKVVSYQNAPMMSWKMIKEMQQTGIEIGAHTLTHPSLTQCGLQEVKRQMIGSRNRLEEKLCSPVQLFAYPYGGVQSINKSVQSTARETGFLAACTTLPGSNGPDTDLYALRRMPPLMDEIHRMLFQLDYAASKRSPIKGSKIRGVSDRTIRLWQSRFKRVKLRLAQKSSFYWRIGRFSGS